ncbi:MAG TPA: protein-glutamate O-methyltransferase CheR [Alphaproteobacteria bacterium]|nr:protein-glutamate O-methyltransferase CheR [Alphaproteobacteria bacterium]HNS45352.1 protein-glutamate O-methyltransferase CheR [Alphaproteobacteria bacterium]
MKVADFEIYKSMLYERSGLVITPDKSYLLDSRLTPIAKKWGHPTLEAMTLQLRALPDEALIKDIVEAMTTNETSFFRDTRPFEIFKDTVLPHMTEARKGKKTLRIWCAACSSGQEPYSLAMILKEKELLLKGWRFEIVATDLSEEILATAKKGSYSQFEVQRGLPIQYLMKYFTQVGETWQIKDEIKNMIKFSSFNLLGDMSRMGMFDVVFCRNVLIYFDEKTKGSVLEKMERQMESDGFLFLGGAETVLGITNKFVAQPEKRGLYVKNTGQAAARPSSISSSSSGSATTTASSTSSFTSGLFKRT